MTAAASPVTGLHHVTAICGDPSVNVALHAEVLGLRLVKRTVNFDDPGAWHLYYGDELGRAGSIMTFFAWPNARPGRRGAGQVASTHYAVPKGALPFWRERLAAHGARHLGDETLFGEARAHFADPDGLPCTLVEADDPRAPWTAPDIPEDKAIRGFHGVTLSLREGDTTAAILTRIFGYAEAGAESGRRRFVRPGGTAGVVELDVDPARPMGDDGVGVVHHVAFSVPDRATQAEIRARLTALGHRVTPSIDRNYFHAIYCRTPGGVLFEVATEEPGFAVDEPRESLGAALKLPPQYEAHRREIAAALPPLGR